MQVDRLNMLADTDPPLPFPYSNWPYEHIARQVIRLRMDHGLSQQALADRVGSTKSAISRLESGQHAPTVATLQKIARAFGGRLVVNFETGTPPPRPSVNAGTAAVA